MLSSLECNSLVYPTHPNKVRLVQQPFVGLCQIDNYMLSEMEARETCTPMFVSAGGVVLISGNYQRISNAPKFLPSNFQDSLATWKETERRELLLNSLHPMVEIPGSKDT